MATRDGGIGAGDVIAGADSFAGFDAVAVGAGAAGAAEACGYASLENNLQTTIIRVVVTVENIQPTGKLRKRLQEEWKAIHIK